MPNFSYLIESITMFEYMGQLHLMAAFENKSVQIFEVASGHSIFEFELKGSGEQASKAGLAQNSLTTGPGSVARRTSMDSGAQLEQV